MIRESRYTNKNKLQFAVIRGNRKLWLYRTQVPEYLVQEYCQYVRDGKGTRGWMTIAADIEEETEKLKKRKQLSMVPLLIPETLVQETANPKGRGQLVEKKRRNLKIQESKKIHYDTQKKLEKTKRLDSLRSNYPTQRVNTLEKPAN